MNTWQFRNDKTEQGYRRVHHKEEEKCPKSTSDTTQIYNFEYYTDIQF